MADDKDKNPVAKPEPAKPSAPSPFTPPAPSLLRSGSGGVDPSALQAENERLQAENDSLKGLRSGMVDGVVLVAASEGKPGTGTPIHFVRKPGEPCREGEVIGTEPPSRDGVFATIRYGLLPGETSNTQYVVTRKYAPFLPDTWHLASKCKAVEREQKAKAAENA